MRTLSSLLSASDTGNARHGLPPARFHSDGRSGICTPYWSLYVKTEAITAFVAKLAVGVATAATIGGAAAIVSATSANAAQDQRLTALEKSSEQMAELSTKLDETNKNVAVLNERLNQEIRHGQPPSNR